VLGDVVPWVGRIEYYVSSYRVHPDVVGGVSEKAKAGNEKSLKSLLDIVATTTGGSATRSSVSRTIADLPNQLPLSFHLRPDEPDQGNALFHIHTYIYTYIHRQFHTHYQSHSIHP
jgi:hypothetical protein